MTIRELYEYALIEMNKVEAPSLLLEDYNYFINKAVQQYINKTYNRYDINQQSTDDLRVLKATVQLKLKKEVIGKEAKKNKFVYVATLPSDYVHILNCIVEFKVNKTFKCYDAGDHVSFAAKRLTADMAAGILHNVYMKPDYKRPYFYINNVNLLTAQSTGLGPDYGDLSPNSPEPLNEADTSAKKNTTSKPEIPNESDYETHELYEAALHTWSDAYAIWLQQANNSADSVKPEDVRYGNVSDVRIEIRYGDDDSVFIPDYLFIDYIKAPMFIRLTYEEVTSTVDTTRMLEFPDYVCFEIVNEFVKLLMENASDPRLQTNYTVNQTIANPLAAQQQESQSRDKS